MSSVLLVVAIALVAALFMSWTVGVNSNSAPVAPAVGANALTTLRAALLVGVAAALGALLQGGSISATIGNGLVTGVSITPLAAAATLLTSAALITVGNTRGYPIPSAFTVTGATVGAGVALGGGFAVPEYLHILAFWLTIPVFNAAVAYLLVRALRDDRLPEGTTLAALVAGVGFVVANVHLSVLAGGGGGPATLAGVLARDLGLPATAVVESYPLGALVVSVAFAVVAFAVSRYDLGGDRDRGIQHVLVGLGLLVVFTSGGTQVGLATGPLESLFKTQLHLPTLLLLGLGAAGILAGAWTRAPRLIQAVSQEYATLGPRRSIAALIPAFVVAQAAIVFGIPISFNKVMISAIVGSGFAARSAGGGVSGRKSAITIGSWVASLVGAGLISWGLYHALVLVPGLG